MLVYLCIYLKSNDDHDNAQFLVITVTISTPRPEPRPQYNKRGELVYAKPLPPIEETRVDREVLRSIPKFPKTGLISAINNYLNEQSMAKKNQKKGWKPRLVFSNKELLLLNFQTDYVLAAVKILKDLSKPDIVDRNGLLKKHLLSVVDRVLMQVCWWWGSLSRCV